MNRAPSQFESRSDARRRRRRALLSMMVIFLLGVAAPFAAIAISRATLGLERTAYVVANSLGLRQPVKFIDYIMVCPGTELSRSLFQLDNPDLAPALWSMLRADASHRESAVPGGEVLYTIRFSPPGGLYRDLAPAVEVRRQGNDFIWSKDGVAYRMEGDFEAFLQALPAVRCAQLAMSSRDWERREAVRLKDLHFNAYCDALIAATALPTPEAQAVALRALTNLVGGPPRDVQLRWVIDRNSTRDDAQPRAADVRRAALTALEEMLRRPTEANADGAWGRLRPVVGRALQRTGNADTAKRLVQLLPAVDGPMTDLVLDAIETIVGLPPSYDKHLAWCGNTTAAEHAEIAAQNDAARRAGRDCLVQWFHQHGGLDQEALYDAVLARWDDVQRPDQRDWEREYPRTEPAVAERLLGLGNAIVPAIERRQKGAVDLPQQGRWEIVRAYILTDCDANLVDQLLAGGVGEQTIACRIIAGSGQTTWRDRLVPLLHVDNRDLIEAAAFALLACHGPEVVDELRTMKNHSYSAAMALHFYRNPMRPREEHVPLY